MGHGFFVALFDVLGFEERLKRFGLPGMLERYEALIDVVNYRKEHMQHVFGKLGFSEAPYWTAEGDVFIFTETYGAYASDSILLWAHRTWPEARNVSDDVFQNSADNPADGWTFHPVPCDNFLDVCNDLMCRGIEIGLPLRGAVAIGDAVLDQDRGIFLGQPIVDAARLESGQQLIGAGFCLSTANQVTPQRFSLQFDKHLKHTHRHLCSGSMLDWPRHWRRSRKTDLSKVVAALNTDPQYATYYENTLELIALSETFSGKFESPKEMSVRTQYDPFSWDNTKLAVKARAVRRIPIQDAHRLEVTQMHPYRELLRIYTLQAAKEDGLIRDQDNARDLARRLGAWEEASYRAVLNNRRAKLLELAECRGSELFEPASYREQAQTITEVLTELPIVLRDPEQHRSR